MSNPNYLTPKNIFRFLIVFACILLSIVFYRSLVTALIPFIIGIFLAAFLEPIIGFHQKRLRMPRTIAILTTLSVSVVLISYILVTSAAKMITELVDLVNQFPQYQELIVNYINDAILKFEVFNENLPQVVRNSINSNLNTFFDTVENWVNNLTVNAINAFSKLPAFIIVTIVTIVATYFFSKDKSKVTNAFVNLVPTKWQSQVSDTLEIISVDLVGYIKGRLIVLLLSTSIAAVGLVILNNRYWMILAIVIGIIDLIPIIGPAIIFGPWIVVLLLLGNLQRAIFLGVLYMAIFISHQALEPKIMGNSVGIHPLVMLVAFYSGYIFFGALGLFIGPISIIIIRAAINTGIFKLFNFPE